jgi:hypothetical protein
MELVTANNQGELSSLEIGRHALKAVPKGDPGRGKKGGVSEYARRIGRNRKSVEDYIRGVEVYSSLNMENILHIFADPVSPKTFHLAAVYKLPRECWPAACAWLAGNRASVEDVERRVRRSH